MCFLCDFNPYVILAFRAFFNKLSSQHCFNINSDKNDLGIIREDVSRLEAISFGIPGVMGAIISLGCNWWSNMHQIDT